MPIEPSLWLPDAELPNNKDDNDCFQKKMAAHYALLENQPCVKFAYSMQCAAESSQKDQILKERGMRIIVLLLFCFSVEF